MISVELQRWMSHVDRPVDKPILAGRRIQELLNLRTAKSLLPKTSELVEKFLDRTSTPEDNILLAQINISARNARAGRYDDPLNRTFAEGICLLKTEALEELLRPYDEEISRRRGKALLNQVLLRSLRQTSFSS